MISIMSLLNVSVVFICIFFLAYLFRVSLVEAMPVFTGIFVLVLYVLAMLHHLSWIDGIAVLAAAAFAVWLVSRSKEVRKEFVVISRKNVTHASFIAAVLLIAAVALCTSGKVVTWWDDINFWATDVKSLYFLDGFAGKYENAAPEFGDYPPGAQLIKWWFLHLNPDTFHEGLAFVGYYMMNMVFLLPLLRRLRGRNVAVMILMAAALWFLPGIAEVYGYEGFCADLTMACIYGSFLLAVTDRETESDIFYYGRLALYLSVLVLVKSIGFVWALFGLIFFLLYRFNGSTESKHSDERTFPCGKKRWLAFVAGLPILTGGSWMLFCLLMRRITRTTATAVKYMTTDEYGISGYSGEFAGAFVKAFVGSPLHKERSLAIDLTPLGFYLCICLLVILFYRADILPKRSGKIVLFFSVVSGALFYAIIFVAHITIFATETQYLEASGMISSIERYGAPFTIGTLVFLAGVWLDGAEHLFSGDKTPDFVRRYGVFLCFIIFVALTTGYRAGYDGLIGYRDSTEDRLRERASMIGADEERFLDALSVLGTDHGTRVCYVRRGDVPRWVNNSYTAYEAAPISVTYISADLAAVPTDWIAEGIRATHAAYLYAEETDADAGTALDEMMSDGTFLCGVLYFITDDGTGMKLTPAD